jgi:hypothetical protein
VCTKRDGSQGAVSAAAILFTKLRILLRPDAELYRHFDASHGARQCDRIDFMDPDEVWAYRARSVDDITPVKVLRFGITKPARVLVRFEDPSMRRREEWVPPGRLKVPWADADAYRAREARWAAVRTLAPPQDSPEASAARDVFEWLVDPEVAYLDWQETCLSIGDVDQLAQLCGLSGNDLTGDPVGFAEDGQLVASWPLALKAAKGVAAIHPDRVLAEVDREEREYQRDVIYGRRSEDMYIEPELIQSLNESLYAPKRALLRQWCGDEAGARWDELVELRKEIRRVGEIAERAIVALRTAKQRAIADRLEYDLGQTVDMLRSESTED